MASLFTCFCSGKRGKKITIKSKDIDGGSGTTKESPSKLKPIKALVAAFDVGRQSFKVKRHKDSLETDGVEHGGGKDSASDRASSKLSPVIESSPAYLFRKVGSANVGEGDGTKNDWFKIQTFDLRGNGGGGGGGGGGGVGGSSGNGGVTVGQQG